MASSILCSPLDGVEFKCGEYQPDVTLSDVRGQAYCQLLARRGKASELASRLGIRDRAGQSTVTDDFTALPMAPGQWLMIGSSGRDGAFTQAIAADANGLGYASEQSHARAQFRIEGLLSYDVLAKGVRLDLDPLHVKTGFVAQTVAAQVGLTLHKVNQQPTFDLIVYSGFALSFWQWLIDASEEYNVDTQVL